jgi:hypothetical protein
LHRQRSPRLFHALKCALHRFVSGAFSKQGTVLGIITKNIRQIHIGEMAREESVSTGLFREMFVRSGGQTRCGHRVLESARWLEYSLLQVSPVANYFTGAFLLKQYECHE